jgi:hypothetical protein
VALCHPTEALQDLDTLPITRISNLSGVTARSAARQNRQVGGSGFIRHWRLCVPARVAAPFPPTVDIR